MRRADFSVQLERRKPPCVLDPALVLAHAQGPALALRLAAVLEPWLTRSFWQALDASELLLMQDGSAALASVNGQALQRWLALRESTDSGSWVLRWLGDRWAESNLLDSADADVIDRYESLAASLQARAAPGGVAWCGFDAERAAQDTLSLSATLDGALLLCAGAALPPPVQMAQALGLVVEPPERLHEGSWLQAERHFLREAVAAAGAAALAQALPPLVAAHVCLDDEAGGAAAPGEDPWAGARVWWYRL